MPRNGHQSQRYGGIQENRLVLPDCEQGDHADRQQSQQSNATIRSGSDGPRTNRTKAITIDTSNRTKVISIGQLRKGEGPVSSHNLQQPALHAVPDTRPDLFRISCEHGMDIKRLTVRGHIERQGARRQRDQVGEQRDYP